MSRVLKGGKNKMLDKSTKILEATDGGVGYKKEAGGRTGWRQTHLP